MRRLLALTFIAILIPLAVVAVVNVVGSSADTSAGPSGFKRPSCC
jgi:hypothetical protein